MIAKTAVGHAIARTPADELVRTNNSLFGIIVPAPAPSGAPNNNTAVKI